MFPATAISAAATVSHLILIIIFFFYQVSNSIQPRPQPHLLIHFRQHRHQRHPYLRSDDSPSPSLPPPPPTTPPTTHRFLLVRPRQDLQPRKCSLHFVALMVSGSLVTPISDSCSGTVTTGVSGHLPGSSIGWTLSWTSCGWVLVFWIGTLEADMGTVEVQTMPARWRMSLSLNVF